MNCYFHPQAEAVVNCGKCGVSMCRECESNAFFRLGNGSGQALCVRCSLEEAQSKVSFKEAWLKKRFSKLIICAVLIFVGLIAFASKKDGDSGSAWLYLIICWFAAGVISKIGIKAPEGSVKSQAKDAMYEYDHPFMSMFFSAVGYTILGPLMLIANFMGYARTKSEYNNDLQNLESIKAAVNQSAENQ